MQETLFGDNLPRRRTRPAPSGPHVDAMRAWNALWRETRGCEFEWTPKDQHGLKLGMKLAGSFEEWANAARKMLVSPPSAWYAQEASPMLLYSRWNALKVTVRPMTRDEKNLTSLRMALEGL